MVAGVMLFLLDWRVALISWGTFIVVAGFTRYVSLGSIIAEAMAPVAFLFVLSGCYAEFCVVLVSAVLLIARHSANIKRLLHGEEPKFSFQRQVE